MNKSQIIVLIESTLNDKMKENNDFIRYTYYELKVKYNLTELEIIKFTEFLKNKLENNNYLVYKENDKYEYKNTKAIVKSNEILIAIKKEVEKNGNLHKSRNGIIKKSKRLYRK